VHCNCDMFSRFGFIDKGFLQHSEWSPDSEHVTSGRRADSGDVFHIFISHKVKSHTHRAVTNNHCHIVFKCIHQLSLSTGRKMHSKLKNTNLLKCSLLFSTHHQSWCTFIAETHLLFNSINQQHRCCTP
jgi:hypothetical protein